MNGLVYDCFLFFNELEMLEIRLNILKDVVDKFVLVEANKTFSFNDKPYYFEDNKHLFEEYREKIIYVKINDYPDTNDTWEMQSFQRNQISLGLTHCSPSDIILISDLDEIPNPEVILNYRKNLDGIYKLKQFHFAYYLNYQRIGINKYWYPAKILRYKDIINNNLTPQVIRSKKNIKYIKYGGWHFSFLGGIEKIKIKIKSISMQEWNKNEYLDEKQLEYKIKMGLDLFDRKGRHLIPVKMSIKKHPEYIMNNLDKYSHFIYPHINKYVVVKNTLLCFPFVIKDNISIFFKTILPKKIVLKIQKLKQKT